jgi:hypothetical protein
LVYVNETHIGEERAGLDMCVCSKQHFAGKTLYMTAGGGVLKALANSGEQSIWICAPVIIAGVKGVKYFRDARGFYLTSSPEGKLSLEPSHSRKLRHHIPPSICWIL